MHAPSTLHDLINAMDESINTVRILSGLGPLMDGNHEHFESCIEVLSLIAQQAGHLEKLSTSLAHVVIPRPRAMEGTP
jgi:hypothetical protein